MRAVVPNVPTAPAPLHYSPGARRLSRAVQPFIDLATNSDSIFTDSIGEFKAYGAGFELPRCIFLGPPGGADTLRIGMFATFEGDEEKSPALVHEWFQFLDQHSELARGNHIFAYPICNPAGFEKGSRLNASGEDLTKHFWRGSAEPEVYYLEREMGVHLFHGVISLHLWDRHELGVCVRKSANDIFAKELLDPALRSVDGMDVKQTGGEFAAGFLTNTDELRMPPFEINLRVPKSNTQICVKLLSALLESYRGLQAYRQNL